MQEAGYVLEHEQTAVEVVGLLGYDQALTIEGEHSVSIWLT